MKPERLWWHPESHVMLSDGKERMLATIPGDKAGDEARFVFFPLANWEEAEVGDSVVAEHVVGGKWPVGNGHPGRVSVYSPQQTKIWLSDKNAEFDPPRIWEFSLRILYVTAGVNTVYEVPLWWRTA